MKRDVCPHCGQNKPLTYKYHLDDMDVSALAKIWNSVVAQGVNKIKITSKTIPELSDGERLRLTQLRFHGMIAKVRGKNGKQIGGMWLITKRAAGFLSDGAKVPSFVLTRQNQVIGHSPDSICRANFRVLDDFRATYEIIDEDVVPKQNRGQIAMFNN